MAKFKLSAGSEIDLLDKKELDATLKAWFLDTIKGARPIRFTGQGTIAANAVTVDANNINNKLGPDVGYFWIVNRVAISGLVVTTDPTSIYINNASPLSLVRPLTGMAASTGYVEFNKGVLTLSPGDTLVVASTASIASTGTVTVSGSAVEIPSSLLWKLI